MNNKLWKIIMNTMRVGMFSGMFLAAYTNLHYFFVGLVPLDFYLWKILKEAKLEKLKEKAKKQEGKIKEGEGDKDEDSDIRDGERRESDSVASDSFEYTYKKY